MNPTYAKLQSVEDIDQNLQRLKAIKLELDALQHKIETQVKSIREGFAAKLSELSQALDTNANQVLDFLEANSGNLFVDKRSIELNFGTIGAQLSIAVETGKDTLEKLRKLGLTDAIKITEAPDKAAMEKLDPKTFAKTGAQRVQYETLWIKLAGDGSRIASRKVRR